MNRETAAVDQDLVMSFLPVIRRIAGTLVRRLPAHIRPDDLEAAGIVGLLQAAQQRDPNRAELFDCYARRKIEGAMLDELRREDMLPKDARALSNRILAAMSAVEMRCGTIDEEAVADELRVGVAEYRGMLERTVDMRLVSMESKGLSEELFCDEGPTALELVLAAETGARVAQALERLPDKQRRVLALYYIEELNMKEIALAMNMSPARVCQLHSEAVHRVRAMLASEEKVI